MEKSKIKTGIFGGSFNPIHMGHLALANYLCEYNGLDEIWFLVSPHNPLKQQTDLWDDNLRLELVNWPLRIIPNSELPISSSTFLVLPILYTHWMLYTKPIPTGNSPLSSGRTTGFYSPVGTKQRRF